MVPRTGPGLAVRNAVGRAVARTNRIASREAANR